MTLPQTEKFTKTRNIRTHARKHYKRINLQKHLKIMKTYGMLKKEAKKAPKFYLCAWNDDLQCYIYIFIADRDKCNDAMCVNVSKAQLFDYGFDDEQLKERAWSKATGFDFLAIAVS